MEAGKCEVDVLNHYSLVLPVNTKEFSETDLSEDRSEEVDALEREP